MSHTPTHRAHKGKQKTQKQVGYLLSRGSPLTAEQRARLRSELHTGAVRVRKSRRKGY